MALVHIGFRIVDDDGDTSTMSVKVPQGSLTIAELTEFAEELAVLIDDCIDGAIQQITLAISVSLPGGLQASPVANSEVQRGGLLSFSATGTPYRFSIRVPAFTPSKFAGNTVDDQDSDVTALLLAFTAGLDATGTQVQPCDKYENDLSAYIEGVKSFRH